jgi:hypothetical protein
MFEQLDARGPRLVAQKAIETFLGEALLPAPEAEARFGTPKPSLGPAKPPMLPKPTPVGALPCSTPFRPVLLALLSVLAVAVQSVFSGCQSWLQ